MEILLKERTCSQREWILSLRVFPYGMENHFYRIRWPPLNVTIFIRVCVTRNWSYTNGYHWYLLNVGTDKSKLMVISYLCYYVLPPIWWQFLNWIEHEIYQAHKCIAGILTFFSMKNTTSDSFQGRKLSFFSILVEHEELYDFRAVFHWLSRPSDLWLARQNMAHHFPRQWSQWNHPF